MMWRNRQIIPMILAAVLAGCSPNSPSPHAPPPSPQATPTSNPPPPAASSGSATTEPVVNAFPTIPDGAVFTLYCLTITTPTHIPDSERLKEQLIRHTGMKDWYVIHQEGQSILNYGFYKTFSDNGQPLEKQRAQTDRLNISRLRDNNGETPFAACGFQPIAAPDPDAPPEWDLRHAPGYWALNIGSYTGSPARKKAAVDAVRDARAAGIEAYYYHGPNVSSVLIGTWPREAVKEQDASVASSNDPNKTVFVTSEPLPPNFKTEGVFTKEGQPVKVFSPKVEIQDPTLLAAMRQYPANAVNGQVYMHNVQTPQGIEQRPDPSFLVVIPHDDQNVDQNAPVTPAIPGG